jgi:hypothetical protein
MYWEVPAKSPGAIIKEAILIEIFQATISRKRCWEMIFLSREDHNHCSLTMIFDYDLLVRGDAEPATRLVAGLR